MRRRDRQQLAAAHYAEVAAPCAAIASGGGDQNAAGWWWFTAAAMDTQAALRLLPELRAKGLLAELPPPRAVTDRDMSAEKAAPGTVTLPDGTTVAGEPVEVVERLRPRDWVGRASSARKPSLVVVGLLVGEDGVGRQPLLVKADGLPLHAFVAFAYLRQWRFAPAKVDGKPTVSSFRLSVGTQEVGHDRARLSPCRGTLLATRRAAREPRAGLRAFAEPAGAHPRFSARFVVDRKERRCSRRAEAMLITGSLLIALSVQVCAEPSPDRVASRETMASIRNVGTAMMSWLTDQIAEGPAARQPEATLVSYSPAPPSPPKTFDWSDCPSISRQELRKLLAPVYIRDVPQHDGWGNELEFCLEPSDFTKRFYLLAIRSPGRDGIFERGGYEDGAFDPDDFDADIVWVDGYFVRWPQRLPPQR